MWQVVFLVIPLLFIAVFSFLPFELTPAWAFTLKNYIALFQWEYVLILFRSILLGLCTATLCLLSGYAIAYYLVFRLKRLKLLALFFLIVPFWTNLLVLVYSWFFVLEPHGLLNSLLFWMGLINKPIALFNTMYAVIIVMVYCYLPFMILPLVSSLEKLDTSLIEASYDLGATARQTFMRVILPLSASGIQTGFLLVFVPAFGEFAIPSLIGGDKVMFAGSLISYYFLVARNNPMGAAFTCLSGVVLMLVVIMLIFAIKRLVKNA